jgi:hypothetical protein
MKESAAPEAARPATAAALTSLVAEHRPDVETCFTRGRAVNRALAGTIQLELQVGPDGRVRRVQTRPTFHAPRVVECVVALAKRWTFPVRTGGDVMTVAVPLTIN